MFFFHLNLAQANVPYATVIPLLLMMMKMKMKAGGAPPYPHFADGVSQAFVAACLVQRYSIKLSFIQITHRPFTLLLPQGPGGVQSILERVSVHKKRSLKHLNLRNMFKEIPYFLEK